MSLGTSQFWSYCGEAGPWKVLMSSGLVVDRCHAVFPFASRKTAKPLSLSSNNGYMSGYTHTMSPFGKKYLERGV